MNETEIKKLLEDHQELHSDFQIDNFIIRSQGDEWAQYKQCLREIKSRIETNESEKAYTSNCGIIKERERELDRFLKRAVELKQIVGDIDHNRRHQLESESWKNKGLKLAAIDVLATGRVTAKTYEFIFALPKRLQVEIFLKLKSHPHPLELLGFNADEIKAISGPDPKT